MRCSSFTGQPMPDAVIEGGRLRRKRRTDSDTLQGDIGGTEVTLSRAALDSTPEQFEQIYRMAQPDGFREFLNVWTFFDQERRRERILGHEIWRGQEAFIAATREHSGIYSLKSRKLGLSTLASAYDGWVARFHPGARVHLFSRRQAAANDLLGAVHLGLSKLPAHLKLPLRKTVTELKLEGAGHVVAYPADEDTSVESTATHVHLDEWARMANPARVWQAVEPTIAGSAHILTTSLGPENFASTYWRRALAGDVFMPDGSQLHPLFISALNRPDRTEVWLEGKRSGMTETQFRREYPMTWQDALAGDGEYVFDAADLDTATTDCMPPSPAVAGHRYVIAWDIGIVDATVGTVLDVTTPLYDVAHIVTLRGASYPEIQRVIEQTHAAYPGVLTVIEDNAAGAAVRANLNIPDYQVEGFKTTTQSKPHLIADLQLAFQNQVLKYDPQAFPALDAELRGYQVPDKFIIQDHVMSLAIALKAAQTAVLRTGRVRGVVMV